MARNSKLIERFGKRGPGVAGTLPLPAAWQAARIPAQTAVLENGLTLVAHRDPKAPIVAVYAAYHAGSRDEPPSKAGLAHLSEHLMFSGTEHCPEQFFLPMERLGATSINAVTTEDYSAYFETVPVGALDAALWMEAERMGWLAGALDQSKLDRQREVVRNELLQRESEPYGKAPRLISQHTYGPSHPYGHPANGLIEDLDDISLADATQWFKTRYGAANAIVVIAGDIEPGDAIQRARRHFEPIAPGPPLPHPRTWVQPRMRWVSKPGSFKPLAIDERVPAARIYMVWNVPEFGSPEHSAMELACEILAGGVTSRLHHRLVEEKTLASDVGSEVSARELGSQVIMWATARSGIALSSVEDLVRSEIARLCAGAATIEEVRTARLRIFSRFVRDTERIGGMRSKSEALAISTLLTGDANADERRLAAIAKLQPSKIAELAAKWLGDGAFVLEVKSECSRSRLSGSISHDRYPPAVTSGQFCPPEPQPYALPNGLRVLAVERKSSPIFEFRFVMDGGFSCDDTGKRGMANVAIATLLDKVPQPGAVSIAVEQDRLNAPIEGRAQLDASVVRMSTFHSTLAGALKIYADVLRSCRFDAAALRRAKDSSLSAIRRERNRPLDLAMRVLPALAYGPTHPYAIPMTGSGTESGVAQVSIEDVRRFNSGWSVPQATTLIAVGPISTSKMKELAERSFGGLRATPPPLTHHGEEIPPAMPTGARIVLVDEPGRNQSAIFTALAAAPRNSRRAEALIAADTVLGGSFTSRLNMNLRERKGWTYGARSLLLHARGPGLWLAYAFVQADVTAAAMSEIEHELRRLAAHPPAGEELRRAADYLALRMPAQLETNAQLAATIEESIIYGLPDTYYHDLPARWRSVREEAVAGACRAVIDEKPLSWLVVGDAREIAPEIENANLGELEIITSPDEIP